MLQVLAILIHFSYEIIYGFVLGTLTSMVMESRKSTQEFEEKMATIREFCKIHRLGPQLSTPMLHFFQQLYPDDKVGATPCSKCGLPSNRMARITSDSVRAAGDRHPSDPAGAPAGAAAEDRLGAVLRHYQEGPALQVRTALAGIHVGMSALNGPNHLGLWLNAASASLNGPDHLGLVEQALRDRDCQRAVLHPAADAGARERADHEGGRPGQLHVLHHRGQVPGVDTRL